MDWTYPVIADGVDMQRQTFIAADAYGLSGFPFMTLIDSDGKVIARWSGEMRQGRPLQKIEEQPAAVHCQIDPASDDRLASARSSSSRRGTPTRLAAATASSCSTLTRRAGDLDADRLTVDLDRALLALLRPAFDRRSRGCRACRSRRSSRRTRLRTWRRRTARARCGPACPSSSRSASPTRRRRRRPSSSAIVCASTSPVTSSTLASTSRAGRPGPPTRVVGQLARRRPARRWGVRAGRPCRRRTRWR